MDAKFIAIVQKLVKEQGSDTLIDAKKCKAHLADYSNNEFKKERHLLLVAIEAGAAQAIANANDLAICKKQQIRYLKDDHFIDENAASEAVDLLALALRGDRNVSITAKSQNLSAYNPPQTAQNYGRQSAYNPSQYNRPVPYNPPQQNNYYQQPQSTRVEYIGFWARLLAWIIDAIVIYIILFCSAFLLVIVFRGGDIEAAVLIANIVIAFVYTLAFWINKQATLGKMLFGAKIVDARTLGKPSDGQLVGRYFAYILSALPFGLGFLWIAFDSKKRGWHDMLAGTLVIRA